MHGVVTKLPNSRRDFALRRFRRRLSHCGNVAPRHLHTGLVCFLRRVAPMTSRTNIVLIVRPSSPPYSVLNLPHVVDYTTSFRTLVSTIPGGDGNLYLYANSLNMDDTGSYTIVVRRFTSHVGFIRLHDARHSTRNGFCRTGRLRKSISVCRIVGTFLRLRRHHNISVPVQPSRKRRVMSSLGGGAGPNCSYVNHLHKLTRLHKLRVNVTGSLCRWNAECDGRGREAKDPPSRALGFQARNFPLWIFYRRPPLLGTLSTSVCLPSFTTDAFRAATLDTTPAGKTAVGDRG